jgi:predicted RNA-binding Zn-ribbon protein involved in translation (DUF1610 family)
MKGNAMNSFEHPINTRTGLGVCVALAAAIALVVSAKAADPAKGAQRLNELSVIKTVAEVEALKPGDMIAMACAKCRSILVSYVGPKTGKATEPFMRVGEKHLCTGCKSTMEVVGVQKGAHTEIKHVCATCGDDSAYCCATKHSAHTGHETQK